MGEHVAVLLGHSITHFQNSRWYGQRSEESVRSAVRGPSRFIFDFERSGTRGVHASARYVADAHRARGFANRGAVRD